jgi:hypothetical protein
MSRMMIEEAAPVKVSVDKRARKGESGNGTAEKSIQKGLHVG